MELLATSSKISQVASQLRAAIKKNSYLPGSRLSGTRLLAQQFKVSPTTIKYALDILQKERLVRCEHGRGIFVEPQSVDDELEVYMLLWGMRREPCNYFDEITRIAYPPILKADFSFTQRTVFKDSDDLVHFERELARIDQMPQIRCVLSSSVCLREEHFARLSALHCPVVYFADSKYEEAMDYPRNRIVDTADWTVAAIEHFKKLSADEFTIFIPDGSVAFFKEQVRRLVRLSCQAGIRMNLYEIPGALYNEPDPEKIAAYYRRQLELAAAAGHLDCPLLTYGMIKPFFQESEIYRRRLASGVPLLEPQLSAERMDHFFDAVFDLIRTTVNSPDKLHRREIRLPVLLHDCASGINHWYE